MFRFLVFGHPLLLLPYFPAGLVAGAVFFAFARRTQKAYLLVTSAVLLISLVLWWGVARPPLETWSLPPPDIK
jgi:hypothetical protein